MRRWPWTVMGWTAVLMAAAPLRADTQFQYRFEPGMVLLYTMTAEGDGNMEMTNPQAPDGAMQLPIAIQMEMKMEERVVSVDDQARTTRIALRMPGMNIVSQVMGVGTEVRFSEEGVKLFVNGQEMPAQPGMPNFQDLPMFGKPLHIEVDPLGKVVKLERFDLAGLMGGRVPGLNLNQFQNLQQPQSWFVPFPADAIPVGHSWEQDQEIPMLPGAPPLKVKTSYRFEGWEMLRDIRCAKILTRTALEIENLDLGGEPDEEEEEEEPGVEGVAYQPEAEQVPDQQQPPAAMMPAIERMKYQMEGPLYFNVEAGRIERTDNEMTMEMAMRMGPPEGGLSMDIKMTMKTRMDLTEVQAAAE